MVTTKKYPFATSPQYIISRRILHVVNWLCIVSVVLFVALFIVGYDYIARYGSLNSFDDSVSRIIDYALPIIGNIVVFLYFLLGLLLCAACTFFAPPVLRKPVTGIMGGSLSLFITLLFVGSIIYPPHDSSSQISTYHFICAGLAIVCLVASFIYVIRTQPEKYSSSTKQT